jgi:hypothetical protein
MKPSEIHGLSCRALWVLDKVIYVQRVHWNNGDTFEYPSRPLEWPVQPSGLADWRDVLYEGLAHQPTASGLFRA